MTEFRALFTGDHHFYRRGRWEECLRVHRNIARLVRDERVNLYCSGGDVFETRSVAEEREAVAEHWTEVAESCPSIVTRGNHDEPHELSFLPRLRTRHPVVLEVGARVHYLAGAAVAGVAWPDRGALLRSLGDGATIEGANDVAHEALRRILMTLGDELARHQGPRIGLGHFMCDGAVASNGQPLRGQPLRVALSDLALLRAHAVGMSHIHGFQEWLYEQIRIFYSGSPTPDTHGQLEKKGVTMGIWRDAELVELVRLDSGATPQLDIRASWNRESSSLVVEPYAAPNGAEVRFLYDCPADCMTAAADRACKLERQWLADGAESVTVVPRAVAVKRSRTHDVTTTQSAEQMLESHWVSTSFEPGDRRTPLLAKTALIEAEAGGSVCSVAPVELESFYCREIGTHAGEWGFDLSALSEDDKLVAIVGRNGDGKTFSLECSLPGVMWRDMPTHDPIVQRALTRTAMVESRIRVGAKRYTITHHLDAVSKKSESMVVDENGVLQFEGSGVSTFDAWAAKHLPARSVFWASQFAVQGHRDAPESIIDQRSADRISTVLKALGSEQLEDIAEAARKRLSGAEKALEVASARHNDELARNGDPESLATEAFELREDEARVAEEVVGLERDLTTATEAAGVAKRLQAAESDLATAVARRDSAQAIVQQLQSFRDAAGRAAELRTTIASAASENARGEALESGNRTIRTNRSRLTLAIESAGAEVEVKRARLAEHEALLSLADAIDSAVIERDSLGELLETFRAGGVKTAAEEARLKAETTALAARIPELEAGIATAKGRVCDAAAVEAAVQELPKLRDEIAVRESRIVACAAELDAAKDASRGADARIAPLRAGLRSVAEGCSSPEKVASDAIAADDAVVAAQPEVPARIARAEVALKESRDALSSAQARLAASAALAARASALEADRSRLDEMRSELARVEAEHAASEAALATATADLTERRREYEELRAKHRGASELAAKSELLGAARKSVEELRAELSVDRVSKLQAELQALPAEAAVPARVDVDAIQLELAQLETLAGRVDEGVRAEAAVAELAPVIAALHEQLAPLRASAERFVGLALKSTEELTAALQVTRDRLAHVASARAVAEHRHTVASTKSERLLELEAEKLHLESEVSDWSILATSFGRKGIQLSLIESVADELDALTNDLLHTCFGPRFTVKFETKRAKASGKGEVGELLIYVTDAKNGTTREVLKYSGGQRTFIGEAIRNALVILACHRSGARGPTLVRDESASYLDEQNAPLYVDMLRAVVAKVGASRLLLVAHNGEVQRLCDARLDVSAPYSAPKRVSTQQAA